MTAITQTLVDTQTETASAALVAFAATDPKPLPETNRFYAILDEDGGQRVVDLDELAEKTAKTPRRKTGNFSVRDAESFATYVKRHSTPWTEVWADLEKRAILAVLDGHSATTPGHHEHKVTLGLRLTTAWKAWVGYSGKLLAQEQFAEHIEARQLEVIEPRGADLLTIAQTIKQTKSADFESSRRLSDGQTVLKYIEESKTSAGKSGEFEVPETFTLAVSPFEGSDPFKVTARLRTRIDGGHLMIGYVLDRPDEVLEAAFADVFKDVCDLLGDELPVLVGWPA